MSLPEQRNGDFSGFRDALGTLFAGNLIPAARIDRAAAAPNQRGANGATLPFHNCAITQTLSSFDRTRRFVALMPSAAIHVEGNVCRLNRLASGVLDSDERSISHWFNAVAFEARTLKTYGGSGWNVLQTPGLANLDPVLSTSTRWDAADFNALNDADLNAPVHPIDSPAFGRTAGVIQFGARLEF